jgi:hypothetical protein
MAISDQFVKLGSTQTRGLTGLRDRAAKPMRERDGRGLHNLGSSDSLNLIFLLISPHRYSTPTKTTWVEALSPTRYGVNRGYWLRWRAGEKARKQQRSTGHNRAYEFLESISPVILISDFRADLIVEFAHRARNRQ